jgi:hypothetical protein
MKKEYLWVREVEEPVCAMRARCHFLDLEAPSAISIDFENQQLFIANEPYLRREPRSEPVCEMGLSGQGVENCDCDADEVAGGSACASHGEGCDLMFVRRILGIILIGGDFVNVSVKWGPNED